MIYLASDPTLNVKDPGDNADNGALVRPLDANLHVGKIKGEDPRGKLTSEDIKDVSQSYIEQINLKSFSRDLELTQSAIDILDLDQSQIRAIKQIIKDVRSDVEQLEIRNLRLVEEKPDKIVIEVSSFRSEGMQLLKNAEAAIIDSIGEDKARLLLFKGSELLRAGLRDFGFNDQQYVLTSSGAGFMNTDAQSNHLLKESDRLQIIRRSGMGSEIIYDDFDNQIPEEYEHLFKIENTDSEAEVDEEVIEY